MYSSTIMSTPTVSHFTQDRREVYDYLEQDFKKAFTASFKADCQFREASRKQREAPADLEIYAEFKIAEIAQINANAEMEKCKYTMKTFKCEHMRFLGH